jgi:hypothetical protein
MTVDAFEQVTHLWHHAGKPQPDAALLQLGRPPLDRAHAAERRK